MTQNGRLARMRWMILTALLAFMPAAARAQVSYEVHFKLEKATCLAGEPVFCDFVIKNTGTKTFSFSYRLPIRAANPELESEPHFTVTDARGRRLPDAAPHACGGGKGSVVYGSVTLPPGGTHVERWLVNEWARIAEPGVYHLRAERRLPLFEYKPETFTQHPAAYALALDELSLRIEPSSQKMLREAFRPYIKTLRHGSGAELQSAVMVVSTLPHPFLLSPLAALAESPAREFALRQQALQGLARLDTPGAWRVIRRVAEGRVNPRQSKPDSSEADLRAYAILLLGEKGDAAFLPPLLHMLRTAQAPLRGNILQTLGFFHDPRASQALMEKLHARDSLDRVNAILGLKNLGVKEMIPPLMAMLNDSDAQVRAVANFALEKLTGHVVSSPGSSPEIIASRWHDWWGAHSTGFEPQSPPPCRDW